MPNYDPTNEVASRKQSELECELNALEEAIDRLEKQAHNLFEGLMPVLRTEHPSECCDKEGMPSDISPVSATIYKFREKVDNIRIAISDKVDRLAV